MQNFSQTPIFSDVADWFAYPALNAANTTTVSIAQSGGSSKGYITLQPDHYFAHCAFACTTNYDNAGDVFATASSAAILSAPLYPNNFLVSIQRGSSNNYSNIELTQAELCSSGGLSGKQMPMPVIYGPAVTLTYTFTDLTQLFLLDSGAAKVPLQINLWMIGYTIERGPNDENWKRFLEYFPALQRSYAIG